MLRFLCLALLASSTAFAVKLDIEFKYEDKNRKEAIQEEFQRTIELDYKVGSAFSYNFFLYQFYLINEKSEHGDIQVRVIISEKEDASKIILDNAFPVKFGHAYIHSIKGNSVYQNRTLWSTISKLKLSIFASHF